jgi:hypothetical protein
VQVAARFDALQMLKERKKYLLNDLLAILNGEAKAQQVTQQSFSEPIEESDHVLFEPARMASAIGCARG